MTDRPRVSALRAVTQVASDLGITLSDHMADVKGNTNSSPLGSRIQACLAGSSALLAHYQQEFQLGLDPEIDWFYEYGDVDLFCYNPNRDAANMSRIETILLMHGYVLLNSRESIRARRVDITGQPKWITNSVRLMSPYGFEVNLINKVTNNNTMQDPIDVLKTFDWSWLTAVAWDLRNGGKVQLEGALRDYFWSVDEPFVLLMSRLDDFKDGIMSQHIMLRQMPRLAKATLWFAKAYTDAYTDANDRLASWGLVRVLVEMQKTAREAADLLIKAYDSYAEFMWARGDKISNMHGDIAAAYALAAREGKWQLILDAAKKYGTKDQLDRLLNELT